MRLALATVAPQWTSRAWAHRRALTPPEIHLDRFASGRLSPTSIRRAKDTENENEFYENFGHGSLVRIDHGARRLLQAQLHRRSWRQHGWGSGEEHVAVPLAVRPHRRIGRRREDDLPVGQRY